MLKLLTLMLLGMVALSGAMPLVYGQRMKGFDGLGCDYPWQVRPSCQGHIASSWSEFIFVLSTLSMDLSGALALAIWFLTRKSEYAQESSPKQSAKESP